MKAKNCLLILLCLVLLMGCSSHDRISILEEKYGGLEAKEILMLVEEEMNKNLHYWVIDKIYVNSLYGTEYENNSKTCYSIKDKKIDFSKRIIYKKDGELSSVSGDICVGDKSYRIKDSDEILREYKISAEDLRSQSSLKGKEFFEFGKMYDQVREDGSKNIIINSNVTFHDNMIIKVKYKTVYKEGNTSFAISKYEFDQNGYLIKSETQAYTQDFKEKTDAKILEVIKDFNAKKDIEFDEEYHRLKALEGKSIEKFSLKK